MDAMLENMKNSLEIGVKKVISSGQKKENWVINSSKTKADAKVFGANLNEICQRENSVVPFIVRDICNFIQENHINVEGIFRISASSIQTTNLRQAYESHASDVDINAEVCAKLQVDAHVAANVLKQFFRRLSEPLIPDEVLKVSQETKCLSDDSFACRVRGMMDTWPEPHRHTLQYLLKFLLPVMRNEKNRMTTTGIAVVFGPNLFFIPTGMEALEVQALANCTFERLLRASDAICNNVKDDQGYLKMTSSPTQPARPARVAPPVPKQARPLPPPPVPTHASDDLIVHSVMTPPPIPSRSKSLTEELDSETPYQSIDVCSSSEHSDDVAPLSPSYQQQSRDQLGKTITHVVRKRLFTADSSSSSSEDTASASSLSCDQNVFVESTSVTFQLLPSLTSGRNNGPPRRKPMRRHTSTDESKEMTSSVVEPSTKPVPKPRKLHQSSDVTIRQASSKESNDSIEYEQELADTNALTISNTSNENLSSNQNNKASFERTEKETQKISPAKSDVIPRLDLSELSMSDRTGLDSNHRAIVQKTGESPARARRRKKASQNQTKTSPKATSQSIKITVTRDVNDDVNSDAIMPEGNSKWRDVWSTDDEVVSVSSAMNGIGLINDEESVCEKVLSSPEHQVVRRQSPYMQRHRRRHRSDNNRSSPKRLSPDHHETAHNEIMTSLQVIMEELESSRMKNGRPEDVTLMTRDQIRDEKVAMQKELLKYEEKHGRPSNKEDKEIMRSIYERYRTVKRLLADSIHPPFKNLSERRANDPNDVDYDVDTLEQSDEFALTCPQPDDKNRSLSPSHKDATISISEGVKTEELRHQLSVARGDKKRLRRKLKEFEKEIEAQYERRVTSADKVVMAAEYQQYKDLSAKIRLLGALIEKQSV